MTMNDYQYKSFDDYLNEIENYGTRYERFLDEWDSGMTPQRMVQWLQAAFECGRMNGRTDIHDA